MMTSEHQVQEGTKVLKLKTKMADKENANRTSGSKNNIRMEKNCIPLKPSNELTNSTIAVDTHNFKDNNQTMQLLPIKDDTQNPHMRFSQGFHLKKNSKENQMTTEKPKQDVANIPKKLVLGSYRGQIVQSKVNSFRKPLRGKDTSSVTTQQLSTTISEATEPKPVNSSVTVKSNRISNLTTTKFASTACQDRQLVRPPIRSHHNNSQDKVKQVMSRPANVTVQKGPSGKGVLQLKTDLSRAQISSSQDTKRNETSSRGLAYEITARPGSFANTKLTEKFKIIDQRRRTAAKATFHRSAQSKETAEERKIRLAEWKAGKERVLKRPPSSVLTQLEPKGQNEKPVGSFWTTMAEEDEQRLFTEKVNKTFCECLNLINESFPKEEILATLNDLVKNIPDAKKLVKYWICLARLEPITSPIENIITIYEKAILAEAQPIEEMRHAIVDILTMKSQEKVKFGENTEACVATEQIQEVNTENVGVNLKPGKLEMESKQHRNVIVQDCEKEQEDKTKEPISDAKTPSKETGFKKKMQFDETNSAFKELKFLTPVRRSRRLQESNSKLPDMLKDHYPCVSSLEQLTELGSETDAFVCRPNAALCRMYSDTEIAEEN